MSILQRFMWLVLLAGLCSQAPLPAQAEETAQLSVEDRELFAMLLRDRERMLLPAVLVEGQLGQEMFAVFGMSVVAVRRDHVTDALLAAVLARGADPDHLMRMLLLWDRALRQEMEAQLAAPATSEGVAGGGAPAPAPAALVPGTWSGALDEAALGRELARFNGAGGAQLEVYQADPVTLILNAEASTVEVQGTPICEVHTRTWTSDGRDSVFLRTVTRYSTNGAQRLHDRTFDVQVSVTRTATDQKGTPVGPQGTTVTTRQATLSKPDSTGARQLIIYNGQPSVHEVPWLLLPSEG